MTDQEQAVGTLETVREACAQPVGLLHARVRGNAAGSCPGASG
jgi:hypothetical protein